MNSAEHRIANILCSTIYVIAVMIISSNTSIPQSKMETSDEGPLITATSSTSENVQEEEMTDVLQHGERMSKM